MGGFWACWLFICLIFWNYELDKDRLHLHSIVWDCIHKFAHCIVVMVAYFTSYQKNSHFDLCNVANLKGKRSIVVLLLTTSE